MAISTDSIIHYTDTIEKLKSILKEGFAIKYCSERLFIEKLVSSRAAHPMVSFCDIPLSQAYKHFNAYGRYGIGLSKAWANKMGINPVLYLDKNSSISRTIGKLIVERRGPGTNLTAAQRKDILRIKCFAKNYSGTLLRDSILKRNYRFYDEREWRLVPDDSQLKGAKFSIGIRDYEDNKDKFNRTISKIRFEFAAEDISYVIVDKTDEIPIIIKVIRNEYKKKCDSKQLDILLSKICSTEQIISDY